MIFFILSCSKDVVTSNKIKSYSNTTKADPFDKAIFKNNENFNYQSKRITLEVEDNDENDFEQNINVLGISLGKIKGKYEDDGYLFTSNILGHKTVEKVT